MSGTPPILFKVGPSGRGLLMPLSARNGLTAPDFLPGRNLTRAGRALGQHA